MLKQLSLIWGPWTGPQTSTLLVRPQGAMCSRFIETLLRFWYFCLIAPYVTDERSCSISMLRTRQCLIRPDEKNWRCISLVGHLPSTAHIPTNSRGPSTQLAHYRLALTRHALCRSALRKSAPSRVARRRSAPARLVFLRSAPIRWLLLSTE